MLALYRAGRQKDALDRFAHARRRLVEDTGLEPGPELRELQTRILRQDPSLDLPAPEVLAPPALPARRSRSRRRLVVAGVGVVAAGGAVAAAVFLWPGAKPVAVPARGLVELDARTGKPVAAIPVSFEPGPVAVSANGLWVAEQSREALVELRPSRRRIALPRTAFALAATGDGVWVANGFDGTVLRVDGAGRAGRPIRPERSSSGRLPLASVGEVLWLGSQDGAVAELGPTGRTIEVVRGVGLPGTVAATASAVWVGRAAEDAVVRVDPRSRRVRGTIQLGGRPDVVAAGDGAVWALTEDADTLWRIDPRRDAVTGSVALPAQPTALALTGDGIWVGTADGILTEVDPASNAVERTRVLGRPIGALAAAGGSLWATVG
jgi:streptogramin lyase